MLTPDYLEGFPDALVALFVKLEDFIIEDVARRVAKAGKITSTAAFQREILGELAAADSAIDAEVAKTLAEADAALGEMYLQAARATTVATGGSYIRKMAEAAADQAKGDLKNLTRTLGLPSKNGQLTLLTDAYREALSLAQLQVSSGAADYMSAVRSALRPFTKSGIYTVDYASGVRRSIESSARQSVLTGVKQMAQEIARRDAKAIGADGWEITAHANCAPDHEPIQGLQYTEKEFEELNASLARSIGSLGCRHIAFPIVLGVSARTYTDRQLAEMRRQNREGISYEGRHYTGYEATQMQRRIERSIRRTKRELEGYDAAGLQNDFTAASIKLRRQEEKYASFSKAAGLRIQQERTGVPGYGFRISQKAVWAEKKAVVAKYQGYLGTKGYKDTVYRLNQIAYNNDKWLLDGFVKAVDKGDISVLVGIDEYIATARKIDAQLVGIAAKDGVVIRGYTTHFIDRIIGQTAEPHPGMRQGVSVEAVKDALLNADKIRETRHKSGKISRQYFGKQASSVVSPEEGLLIQANPRGGT